MATIYQLRALYFYFRPSSFHFQSCFRQILNGACPWRQLGRQRHCRILSFAYLWHKPEKILRINEVDISWYQWTVIGGCVLVSATRIASFINYKASTNQKVFSGIWDSSEHILFYRCKTNGTLAQKEQHINHHKPLVCLLLDMVSTPPNTTWWLVCFDASMQLLNMLLLVVTGRIVHWLGNYFERTI